VRVRVDKSLCVGHGECFRCAPALFPLDQYGYVAIDTVDVPADMEPSARDAVAACPEQALIEE
jgi:ferredoxin